MKGKTPRYKMETILVYHEITYTKQTHLKDGQRKGQVYQSNKMIMKE